MLKHILVGLNGSQYSRAAMELAITWATRYHASLTGLSVVDVPHLTAPQPIPIGGAAFKAERDQAVIRAAEEGADQLLADFQVRCNEVGLAHRAMKLTGDPESLLAREAQRADLLIMGKKSIPPEFGVAASRVLWHVLRHATRPVLCVPGVADHTAAVLVAYDGSAQAAKALQIFQGLGLAGRRTIHLLTVASNHCDRYPGEYAAEYLQAHGHEVQVHVESSRKPAGAVILAEAARLHAGMIVMGSYGQPILKEMFFGSVTSAVLRDTRLPLFLYH